MPASAPPRIVRIGDYVIESQLGCGGMGMVYKAKQISMHRTVALKVLRENLVNDKVYMDRFFQEVRLLACMEHPNMVRVYEAGFDKGHAFFSMEYIDGPDLKLMLDRKHVFTEVEVIDIAMQISSALAYAWRKDRMIHRDIKPANIMMLKNGTAKLLDLGISKKVSSEDGSNEESSVFVTNANVMVGSPSYMSPEQARAEHDIDFRADIYSMGVSMFQLLAGSVPYDGKTAVDVVTQHFSAPIPDVRSKRPDVSRKLAHFIKRMMAKDRNERFTSWETLREELSVLQQKAIEQAAHHSFTKSRENLRILLPRIFIGVGILLILLITALIVWLAMRSGENAEAGRTTAAVEEYQPGNDAADSLAHQTDRKAKYKSIRENFFMLFEAKCDEYLNSKRYQEGIRYCTEVKPPVEFQHGGELESEFNADSSFQNRVNDRKSVFQNLEKLRAQGFD